MKYEIKCGIYIILSIAIILLIILYIFIHTVVVKSILNFPILGKNESKNILDKDKKFIDTRLSKIVSMGNNDTKANKDRVVIKLKDFSITIDSLIKKDKNIFSHQRNNSFNFDNDILDIKAQHVVEKLVVENTQTQDDQVKIIQQKILQSLERKYESNSIIKENLVDDVLLEMEQIKQEPNIEKLVLDEAELAINIQLVDTQTDLISEENNYSDLVLNTKKMALSQSKILEDLHTLQPIANMIDFSNLFEVDNTLQGAELLVCNQNQMELDQSILVSAKIESLKNTLVANNDIGENLKEIKTFENADEDIISSSSVKKIYSMQAADRNMDFKRIVSTYQQVSELYK